MALNRLSLSEQTAAMLILELEKHLSSFFLLLNRYEKDWWLAQGLVPHELRAFLDEAYQEVHQHADLLAKRIMVLGGHPRSEAEEQAQMASISPDPEGPFSLQTALEFNARQEEEIARKFRITIRLALELGDPGTEHLLKKILLAVENRAYRLDQFLGQEFYS